MNGLERYIRQNAEALDGKELPEGHGFRFETKLDKALEAGRRSRRAGRAGAFTLIGVAAAMAAIIAINRPVQVERDWFTGVADDQLEIYNAYHVQVAQLYGTIFANNPGGDLDISVSSVAEESVPLIDLLPEELDVAARAAILKEYYGALLDGLDRINKANR